MKPVPVMVTCVPPVLGPEVGLTAVTVGAEAGGGPARDGHVLDLVDVVGPAGPPGEPDEHVGRQAGRVAEDLGAVHASR